MFSLKIDFNAFHDYHLYLQHLNKETLLSEKSSIDFLLYFIVFLYWYCHYYKIIFICSLFVPQEHLSLFKEIKVLQVVIVNLANPLLSPTLLMEQLYSQIWTVVVEINWIRFLDPLLLLFVLMLIIFHKR